METFAEKVICFYGNIDFHGTLPEGISVMNPFRSNPGIQSVVESYYRRFYNDNGFRHLILGINPGRFGAGVTGIPFTDTVRLWEKCGIKIAGTETHELSSVFIYEMIDAFGGVSEFCSKFFISAVSPLGFTSATRKGKHVNFNYYDSKELADSVLDFILESISAQLKFGIHRDICFCLGTGKNFSFLTELNKKYRFFNEIVPLEHPRFIMQYRLRQKHLYIEKYIEKLTLR